MICQVTVRSNDVYLTIGWRLGKGARRKQIKYDSMGILNIGWCWLLACFDEDTEMSDARGTLGKNNFMRIAILLILFRCASPLWTRTCGKSMRNRLFNPAFDDIPEMDLCMRTIAHLYF